MGDDAGRSLSCFRSRVVFQVVEQPASKTKCTNEACVALQQILSISGGRSLVFVLLCIVDGTYASQVTHPREPGHNPHTCNWEAASSVWPQR